MPAKKKFDAADLPDLTGKVALVTGGNTGIGYETILAFVNKGAKVYMASRTESKAKTAIEQLKKKVPTAQIEYLNLDLTDLANVKEAARKFLALESRLDILVNNAGIMMVPYELTKDGFEIQFQTNHLGHFLFTHELLPLLIKTSKDPNTSVRIVNVSSLAHKGFGKKEMTFKTVEDVNKPWGERQYRYGQSKLANVLYTIALDKRLKDERIWVNAIHPGVVQTDLYNGMKTLDGIMMKGAAWFLTKFGHLFMVNPYEGALTQIYCAGSKEIEEKNYRGRYFVPIAQLETPTGNALDEVKQENLWHLSETILKEKGLI